MVAHETLTEPRVTKEWLLTKRNSLSDLLAFQRPFGIFESFCDANFLLYPDVEIVVIYATLPVGSSGQIIWATHFCYLYTYGFLLFHRNHAKPSIWHARKSSLTKGAWFWRIGIKMKSGFMKFRNEIMKISAIKYFFIARK